MGVARYRQLEGRHLDPQGPRVYGSDVIALKVADPAVEDRGGRGRPHPRLPRRARSSRSLAARYQSEDYIQQVLGFDVRARARPCAWRRWRRSTRSRDRAHQRAAGQRGQERRPLSRRSMRPSTATRGRGTSSGRSATCASARGARPVPAALPHLALLQVCSRLTAHHDAGVPARGLNGEAYRGHVFWDELFVYPFLNLRLPRSRGGCSCTATGGSARRARRPGGGLPRGRCTPGRAAATGEEETQTRPPQPAVRDGGTRTSAATSATSARRSSTTSGTTTRRRTTSTSCATAGAEMMLEIARFWSSDRALQPGARSVGDPRRHGPGRVPREVSRARPRGACATTRTRTSWRPGSARPRRKVLELLPASRRDALRARIGLERRGDPDVGGDEPQDVRAVPRRRGDQPVRGLRGPGGARLGGLTGPSTATSSGSIASCGLRATIPTATSWPSRPTR